VRTQKIEEGRLACRIGASDHRQLSVKIQVDGTELAPIMEFKVIEYWRVVVQSIRDRIVCRV
jgi:hypothetical protein